MNKYIIIKETTSADNYTDYLVMEYSKFKKTFPYIDVEDIVLSGRSKEELAEKIEEIRKTIDEWEVYDN